MTPPLSPSPHAPTRQRTRPDLVVVGPTGMVGETLLSIIAERWPSRVADVRLAGSARSVGQTLRIGARDVAIEPVSETLFESAEAAFFCATDDVASNWAPIAAAAGAVVIDHSSAFRRDRLVPLVTPEANGQTLDDWTPPGIIANPNCTAILAATVLAPLHREAGLTDVTICTYQAASGGGRAMHDELLGQVADHAAGRPYRQATLGRPYLFNLFSHDTPIGPDGFNAEESKVMFELGRLLAEAGGDDAPRISATCVRVPVPRAHSEAIHLRTARPLSAARASAILDASPGVRVVDDSTAGQFPEPALASGGDDVLVGRIRADTFTKNGGSLALFLCGDQLRKGAALNAVQIVERLVQTGRWGFAYTSRSESVILSDRNGGRADP